MYIGDPNNGNRIGTLTANCTNCSNGLTGLGTAAGSVFNQWTYSYKDVVSKVKGAHTMKFGGEVTKFHFVQEAPWSARPNWGFANYWDFLNDATVNLSQNPALKGQAAEIGTFNPLTGVPTDVRKDSRVTWWGFFFQDSWKFRPNLTLTMGLRWDYFGSPYFLHDLLSSVELGTGNQRSDRVEHEAWRQPVYAAERQLQPATGICLEPELGPRERNGRPAGDSWRLRHGLQRPGAGHHTQRLAQRSVHDWQHAAVWFERGLRLPVESEPVPALSGQPEHDRYVQFGELAGERPAGGCDRFPVVLSDGLRLPILVWLGSTIWAGTG